MIWIFGLSKDTVIHPALTVNISVWDVIRKKALVPESVALRVVIEYMHILVWCNPRCTEWPACQRIYLPPGFYKN